MPGLLSSLFGGRRKRQKPGGLHIGAASRYVRARYDAIQTTPDNRKHWEMADGFSADSSNSMLVRYTARNRCRYEVANNAYAKGIVLTLANDLIGTGPRLQMLTDDAGENRQIEQAWCAWARAIDLGSRLRTMRFAKAQDGESFALLNTNPLIDSPVKLDVRLIEADQVSTMGLFPSLAPLTYASDGIVYDDYGNPKAYPLLAVHPGCQWAFNSKPPAMIAAQYMLHWFHADRPGTLRGMPDILPALGLFAQLRRFTVAVLHAAESAADHAVIMSTTAPAGGEAAEVDPMTEMELSPNMAIFTPEGWDPHQMTPEQPATTYQMFKAEIINEIARCLNMPYNVAACNSSSYNYASGRLDHQVYFKQIRVERAHLEAACLDRILSAWLAEAYRVYGFAAAPGAAHQWFWDGHEHVDPVKEATAQEKRLANNTTTLAHEYAAQGKDWRDEIDQRAAEIAYMQSKGVPTAPPQKGVGAAADLGELTRRVEELEDALST